MSLPSDGRMKQLKYGHLNGYYEDCYDFVIDRFYDDTPVSLPNLYGMHEDVSDRIADLTEDVTMKDRVFLYANRDALAEGIDKNPLKPIR